MTRKERGALCIHVEAMMNRIKNTNATVMVAETPDDDLSKLRDVLGQACRILWGESP